MKDNFVTEEYMEKRLHSHTQAFEGVANDINKQFDIFKLQRQQWSESLQENVRDTIRVTVNGKIDKMHGEMKNISQKLDDQIEQLRKEMLEVNNRQDRKIDELLGTTNEVIDAYKESKSFFAFAKKVATWLLPVAGATAIITKIFK